VAVVEGADFARWPGRLVQTVEPKGVEVWDGDGWTSIHSVTVRRCGSRGGAHAQTRIATLGGVVVMSDDHAVLQVDLTVTPAGRQAVGRDLVLAPAFPQVVTSEDVSVEWAELWGLLARGSVNHNDPDDHTILLFTEDRALRLRLADLWRRLVGGTWSTEGEKGVPRRSVGGPLSLHCPATHVSLLQVLRDRAAASQVMSASPEARRAYVDALHGAKRGTPDGVTDLGAPWAQELLWLSALRGTSGLVYPVRRPGLSDSTTLYRVAFASETLPANLATVREVRPVGEEFRGFDLRTESGRFCAGVGLLVMRAQV
jgi:hypothetical protein